MKQENPGLSNRGKMRSLADLASGFVLSLCVRVGGDLRNKYNKKHGQAQCKQPDELPPHFLTVGHLNSQITPSLSFDAISYSW